MQNLNFAIPILAITASAMVLRRLGVHRRLVVPLAFAAGHGVWFAAIVLIVLVLGGSVGPVLLDVCVDLVAIPLFVVMLVRRPSRPWLYALVAYEVVSLILNVGALTGMSGSVVMTMLTHVAIRIAVAVTAVLALMHFDEITHRVAAGTAPSPDGESHRTRTTKTLESKTLGAGRGPTRFSSAGPEARHERRPPPSGPKTSDITVSGVSTRSAHVARPAAREAGEWVQIQRCKERAMPGGTDTSTLTQPEKHWRADERWTLQHPMFRQRSGRLVGPDQVPPFAALPRARAFIRHLVVIPGRRHRCAVPIGRPDRRVGACLVSGDVVRTRWPFVTSCPGPSGHSGASLMRAEKLRPSSPLGSAATMPILSKSVGGDEPQYPVTKSTGFRHGASNRQTSCEVPASYQMDHLTGGFAELEEPT